MKAPLALVLLAICHICGLSTVLAERPPPPKAAPPLPPPEQTKQLIKRSTTVGGMALGVGAILRLPTKSLKTKVVLLTGSLIGSFLLGEVIGEWAYTNFLDEPAPQYHHHSERRPEKQPSGRKQQQQGADIWVDDVEREEIQRKKKTIMEQVFFWRKDKPVPVQEKEASVPAWSDAYQKKQNYDENYGL